MNLLVVVDINLCLGPLASWNLAPEQNVNLAVGTSLELWQEEVCSDQAEETSGTPDVTALAAEITALASVSSCPSKHLSTQRELTVGLSM